MTSKATALRVAVLCALVLILAACGSSSPSQPPGGNGNGNGGGNGGGTTPAATVNVIDDQFQPDGVTVQGGEVVRWTWNGSNFHDVVWAEASIPASQLQGTGTYDATMPTTAGTYVYYCSVHGSPQSGMRGTVTVQ